MDRTVGSGQGWFGSSGFPFRDSGSLNLIKSWRISLPLLVGSKNEPAHNHTELDDMHIKKRKNCKDPKSIDAVMIKFGPGRAVISLSHFRLGLVYPRQAICCKHIVLLHVWDFY